MAIQGITEHGHYWESVGCINRICVDIPNKGFMSFHDKDSAVNALYTAGHRELARTINQAFIR